VAPAATDDPWAVVREVDALVAARNAEFIRENNRR
jgi:hypothetical protein